MNFDVSKSWAILLPPDQTHIKKAAEDLARYIGLLTAMDGDQAKLPPLIAEFDSTPEMSVPIIILNHEDRGSKRNGFSWRATPERVEIMGESGRGLCNGIYSFLAALGLSWPAPGQEKLPSVPNGESKEFPLASGRAYQPSHNKDKSTAASAWRRFVVAEKKTVEELLNKSETLAAWLARQCYDAIVFPLATFVSESCGQKLKQLKEFTEEFGINLEAGGRDLSLLLPRRHFILHRDFFRMEEGKRKKDHHFCPTNPGAIRIVGQEAERLFRAADVSAVYHLWPDKGAEAAWCSCPSCRAFTPSEQNRIAVNIAADVLNTLNNDACITYFEKPGDEGKIPLRKNLFRMEVLPDEYQQAPPV